LSAETSASWKRRAVDATSAGSSGESLAFPSVTRTAVTTFVVVPTAACALTQVCSFISRPYLWSNHRR
jgi:hypothetical protein